jgi:hypothetical protein
MTAVQLEPQIVRRLALVRLLYRHGVEQAQQPEPLAFISVLAFHDAVEQFLILASEHLGANLKRIEFLKYWDELSAAKMPNGVDLSGRRGMERLNRTRVDFKHTGLPPGRAAIDQTHADVRSFFEDNTPKVFGVEFTDIDMADLVSQDTIRDKIKSASAANSAGDRPEGMAMLVEAFEDLFETHTDMRSVPPSPFAFGGRIYRPLGDRPIHAILRRPSDDPNNRYVPVRGEEQLAQQLAQVMGIATELQAAMRVVVLGLDFHQYLRFRRLTPPVSVVHSSNRHHPPDYVPSQDEFDFCQDFVIGTAIRLAELEVHLRPPSWFPDTDGS